MKLIRLSYPTRFFLLTLSFLVLIVGNLSYTATPPDLIDLADVLEPVRADYDLPALAAAVIVEGKLHAAGVVGVRKYGSDVKAELNDPFHLGSCTKAMTASMVCLLVQQGKLKWDTTLAEYFPDLKETMHPDYRKVTLVHLLSHRSGMYPFTHDLAPLTDEQIEAIGSVDSPRKQRKKAAEILLAYPPLYEPGTEYVYSNAGFSLVGLILEETLNDEWNHLIQQMLFDPLGMKSAGLGAMGTPDHIDAPWQHEFEDGKIVPINPGPHSDNPPVYWPGGGVHCSILDWSNYISCFLKASRGEPGLIDSHQLKFLQKPPFDGDYALGWSVCERDWGEGAVYTHTGTTGRNFSVTWISPKKNFAVLVATNIYTDGAPDGCDRICGMMIEKFLNN